MLSSEGDRLTRVVVCSPGKEYFKVDNLAAHNIDEKADPEKAKEQHDRLKAVMKDYGAGVIDIDELSGHPNSVFTRDAALCTPQGYIQLRMGLESRRREEEWLAQALEKHGEPKAGQIQAPGTVEGGDVILAGQVAFIGHSQRTNMEGIRQLSSLLINMGYEIRTASIPPPHLHLGGVMSLIGTREIFCCTGFFEENFFEGFDRLEIDYEMFVSGNVVCLGYGELIAEASNTAAVQALEEGGFRVHVLDLSEFVKGQGGPSCLIMPLERVIDRA